MSLFNPPCLHITLVDHFPEGVHDLGDLGIADMEVEDPPTDEESTDEEDSDEEEGAHTAQMASNQGSGKISHRTTTSGT